MATRDKHDDGKHADRGFLSRWSERKRAAEKEDARPQAAPDADAPASAAVEEARPIDPAELPDIESLHASSDFTVFMRPGVPSALKQRALRRLWQVDPAFKHICMLDDYNLDYTDAAMVVPNLKTIYQVGRGMVLDEPAEDGATPEPPTQQVAAQPAPQPGEPQLPQEQLPQERQSESREPDGELSREQAPHAAGGARVAADSESAPRQPAAPDESQPAVRSARRRRWGDSDSA